VTSRRTLLAAGLAALALPARAQTAWPDKPVRIVVPFAPGGPIDTATRIVAERLRERLGQPFVPENRAGAGGSIGIKVVASAAPDGTTLLVTSSSLAVAPALHPSLGVDPQTDLTPVSLLVEIPTTIAVRADSRFWTLADVVAAARARPATVTYGTSGVGSSNHLSGALFGSAAGIDLVHVPYRGASVAMNALYSGDIDMVFASTVETVPHWREGRVRLLATTTPERVAALSGVPAAIETVPGYVAPNWFAMAAPTGLPAPILARLSAEVTAMRDVPAIRDRFLGLGGVPLFSLPEGLAARLAEDIPRWRRVVAEAGIRGE
jgi:tripartite-type tricarboxylate transporter receptor subunit TctC